MLFNAQYQGRSDNWSTWILNSDDPKFSENDELSLNAYPSDLSPNEITTSNEQLIGDYNISERSIHEWANRDLPSHARHLAPDLKSVSNLLRNTQETASLHIELVATWFLRIYDTIPIYGELSSDDEEWRRLMAAKKFVGLTLRKDLINGVCTRSYLARARQQTLETNPGALGIPSLTKDAS